MPGHFVNPNDLKQRDASLRLKILPPDNWLFNDPLQAEIDRITRRITRGYDCFKHSMTESKELIYDLTRFVVEQPETSKTAGIRLKIENGVVFIKPAGPKAIDRVDLIFDKPYWHGEILISDRLQEKSKPVSRGFADRILSQLSGLGFNGCPQHFVLSEAHYGWYAISSDARTEIRSGMPLFHVWLEEWTTSSWFEDAVV